MRGWLPRESPEQPFIPLIGLVPHYPLNGDNNLTTSCSAASVIGPQGHRWSNTQKTLCSQSVYTKTTLTSMEAICIMRIHVRTFMDVSATVHVHVWVYAGRDKWKLEVYVQRLPQLFSALLETVSHWGWSSLIWLDWPATKTLEILLSPPPRHWDIGSCYRAQLGVWILKIETRPSCYYVYFSDSHIHIPWRSFIWPSPTKTLSTFDALDHFFFSMKCSLLGSQLVAQAGL